MDDIQDEVLPLIATDSRVIHAGWLGPDHLTDLLCAADVYVQPGTQSATMQHSLCCRCPVVLDDVEAHRPYKRDVGWFISDGAELADVFAGLKEADLERLARNAHTLASEMLDYRLLAERVLVANEASE